MNKFERSLRTIFAGIVVAGGVGCARTPEVGDTDWKVGKNGITLVLDFNQVKAKKDTCTIKPGARVSITGDSTLRGMGWENPYIMQVEAEDGTCTGWTSRKIVRESLEVDLTGN